MARDSTSMEFPVNNATVAKEKETRAEGTTRRRRRNDATVTRGIRQATSTFRIPWYPGDNPLLSNYESVPAHLNL